MRCLIYVATQDLPAIVPSQKFPHTLNFSYFNTQTRRVRAFCHLLFPKSGSIFENCLVLILNSYLQVKQAAKIHEFNLFPKQMKLSKDFFSDARHISAWWCIYIIVYHPDNDILANKSLQLNTQWRRRRRKGRFLHGSEINMFSAAWTFFTVLGSGGRS